MYRYKNILANFLFSELDETIIRYSALIARMAETEKVYFVHVCVPSEFEISEILQSKTPFRKHIDTSFKETMKEMVKKHFDGHQQTEVICETVEGKPLDNLLYRVKENNIDLVIVDRENPETSGLKLSERLARNAPCSVLMIPEEKEAKITTVLVAVDFSEYSEDAMETAITFASSAKAELICLHVFSVPIGYYVTGKSYLEFSEIIKKNCRESYDKFISKFDLKGLSIKPLFIEHKSPSQVIMDTVDNEKIDLLVVGVRGRTPSAAVLLGSETEKLLSSTNIPILVVKKKGAGMGLLEAMLKEMFTT